MKIQSGILLDLKLENKIRSKLQSTNVGHGHISEYERISKTMEAFVGNVFTDCY